MLSLIRSTPAFVKPLELSRMKVVQALLTLASWAILSMCMKSLVVDFVNE